MDQLIWLVLHFDFILLSFILTVVQVKFTEFKMDYNSSFLIIPLEAMVSRKQCQGAYVTCPLVLF